MRVPVPANDGVVVSYRFAVAHQPDPNDAEMRVTYFLVGICLDCHSALVLKGDGVEIESGFLSCQSCRSGSSGEGLQNSVAMLANCQD